MIKLKSNFEIDKIRKAGQILGLARDALIQAIKPGITTNKLDRLFREVVFQNHGKLSFLNYHGFPKAICASNNDALIHGIPNNDKLQDGDLLSIDMGVVYDGYHADSAFTISVGNPTPENVLLIKVAEEAFWAGFNQIKKGARVGDISAAIAKVVKHYKMYSPVEYAGHGVGQDLHEEPFVYNQGRPKIGALLKPGMVLAIEPMILQTASDVILLQDGWTVKSIDQTKASHFEHTVAIKEDYTGEILT